MKKYKLIAIDIDGTLLNDQKQLLIETKQDIINAYKNGVNVVIATGRSFPAARQYVDQIDFNIPLILYNGASIRMSKDCTLLYNKTFDNKIASMIFKVINEHNGTCCFWSNDVLYFNKENNYSEYYQKITSIKPIIITDFINVDLKDINKFIWFDNPAELERIKKDVLSSVNGINYFKSQNEMLEIVPVGISKGDTLAYLAKSLNISQEETIAIGDDENDISMIRYAGLGVAMENAKDVVKKEADYITESNNKNGVGKVINKFVL